MPLLTRSNTEITFKNGFTAIVEETEDVVTMDLLNTGLNIMSQTFKVLPKSNQGTREYQHLIALIFAQSNMRLYFQLRFSGSHAYIDNKDDERVALIKVVDDKGYAI